MSKLIDALRKTRFNLKRNFSGTFSSKTIVEQKDFDAIKKALISADTGIKYAETINLELQKNCHKKGIVELDQVKLELKKILSNWLELGSKWQPNQINQHETILVFGINGAGKTTTIAKIAALLKNSKLALAAGDTYRAAAIEQLESWGNKLGIEVIKSTQGSDCASLVFDAIKQTQSKSYDLLIADTSGRLQNNNDLMQELKKVVRVSKKADPNAPQHRWLVIDATLGLNSIEQAKVFHENLDITGIVITKLDSTAKAGAIFAISKEIQVPVVFLTTGEKVEDIEYFEANEFVEAFMQF